MLDKEDLFMACLLVCGGDPEPDNPEPTAEHAAWCDAVDAFFKQHVDDEDDADRLFDEFGDWVYDKTNCTWADKR